VARFRSGFQAPVCSTRLKLESWFRAAHTNGVVIVTCGASTVAHDQFLDFVHSNEDLGNDYIENDFTEKIKNARPLATVLPDDIVGHATLIAMALRAGTEEGDAES
jgi:hypothetical protein